MHKLWYDGPVNSASATVPSMPDYQAIFSCVESTLLKVADQRGRAEELRQWLDESRLIATREFTDAEYFHALVQIPFYSGFKAETVSKRLDTILKYLGDFRRTAAYGSVEMTEMLKDLGMLRNERKIRACVHNAAGFATIVDHYGSFQGYIASFDPKASAENLQRLRRDLQGRFQFLGKITSYHFLTDIGMPVLKPDRVLRRIFCRLGLTEDETETEERLNQVISEGNNFAQVTGHPIRYVDSVFVTYGQEDTPGAICLSSPHCDQCGVTQYCRYYSTQSRWAKAESA
jgi:DNA-3-methyladenine glycosylase I